VPTTPPIPATESARLSVLRSCHVLDTEAEPEFDGLTRMAASLAGTPIALLTLVDEHRQWFKSRVGLEVAQTPRDDAFCAHAIHERAPLIVEDALEDERFRENPLVTAPPNIRFYAGFPLEVDAHLLGTLCIIDSTPRSLDARTRAHLATLARQAASLLSAKQQNARLREVRAQMDAALRELKSAKQQAEAASHAKSNFVSGISHEIRSPLNGLLGMLELLERTGLDAQQRRQLNRARSCGSTLLGLINDVLDLSKIESGCMEIEEIAFDPRAIVQDVVDMFAGEAERKGIELRTNVSVFIDRWLIGDGPKLSQVLVNLVSNAIKFTDDGSVLVTLSTDRSDAEETTLRVTVADTGIGIPEEAQRRLFTPFTQAEASTTRRYGGTGLGLSISRSIVELMGGQITLLSAPGEGSFFSATVCMKRTPGAGRAIEDIREAEFLLVEPDEERMARLDQALDSAGLRRRRYESLERLMDGLEAEPPGARGLRVVIVGAEAREPTERWRDFLASEAGAALLTLEADAGDLRVGVRSLPLGAATNALLGKLSEALCFAGAGPEAEPAPERTEPSAGGERGSARRFDHAPTVLVVDDGETNRIYCEEVLTQAGCDVLVAASGQEAIDIASARAPRLILMDCQMPVMDGLQATERIRVEERKRGIGPAPIVALTASATPDDRIRCLQSGMTGYLAKPVCPDDLLLAVEQYAGGGSRRERARAEDVGCAPSAADADVLDIERLLATCMGRADLLRRLLGHFEADANRRIEELGGAIERDERKRIAGAAHALKGACATIHAERLRQASARLERLVLDSESASLDEAAEAVAEEARRLLETIGATDLSAIDGCAGSERSTPCVS